MPRWAVITLICWLMLAGCSGSGSRPDNYHTVRKGETLYSIAWSYGQNYQEIASLNNIPPPYRIHPGQRLRLTGNLDMASVREQTVGRPAQAPFRTANKPQSAPATKAVPPKPAAPAKKTVVTKTLATKPAPVKPAAPAKKTVTAKTPATKPAPVKPAPPAKKTVAAKTPATKPAPAKPVASGSQGTASWQWPAAGRVKRSVNADIGKMGIIISGRTGQPVHAAADGDVVYSGSGLVGYGNLLIIKHNTEYLSAYGHNQQLLVREGSRVKGGQKIAEMGETAKDGSVLYFEIRRHGKPVDPLNYLPRRQ